MRLSGASASGKQKGYGSWHVWFNKSFGKTIRQIHSAISTLATCSQRWNRSLSTVLAMLDRRILEQFFMDLAKHIIEEAVKEALSNMRKITFYRFYHVFKKVLMSFCIYANQNAL